MDCLPPIDLSFCCSKDSEECKEMLHTNAVNRVYFHQVKSEPGRPKWLMEKEWDPFRNRMDLKVTEKRQGYRLVERNRGQAQNLSEVYAIPNTRWRG